MNGEVTWAVVDAHVTTAGSTDHVADTRVAVEIVVDVEATVVIVEATIVEATVDADAAVDVAAGAVEEIAGVTERTNTPTTSPTAQPSPTRRNPRLLQPHPTTPQPPSRMVRHQSKSTTTTNAAAKRLIEQSEMMLPDFV